MSKRVLIVDSDEATRNLVSLNLKKLGYEVYCASSGSAAISKAIQHAPEILLLDIDLPGTTDGRETLREIRSYKDLKNILTIVVTKRASKEDVIKAIRMGANDYTLKPLKIGTLLAKLVGWANTELEQQWKQLKPEQENTLRLLKVTIERALDSIRQKTPLPYEDIVNAIEALGHTIKEDGIVDIISAVNGYNNTLFLHSLIVAVYMYWFANLKGFNEQESKEMALGGLMHDFGSALIPTDILFKPGKLNPEEYVNIKTHVNYTMDVLGTVSGVPDIVRNICWSHHEKIDGTGYPRGLKGEDISIHARMMAVVESYAALTTKSVYRDLYASDDALKMLYKPEGHLDPALIKDFGKGLLKGFK
ncbi:response regulator receiver modulated metal dependent phosphohydrolase [Candidatus Magnetobacterium bavaricum]|uniref:Response regulator receiver modulated metal dependent phosphohydrolase n=1 Tax=Candidatus Magnetobacterium bavaricum TaxID=29290 RepID=A0A0F3GQJ5_9BACT|nr:response regulator receiver modulated metal dependent phosphohydrolase [Candidatus Magnetobacterium bavaricum]